MLHPAAVCCLALVLAYRVNYTDYSQGGGKGPSSTVLDSSHRQIVHKYYIAHGDTLLNNPTTRQLQPQGLSEPVNFLLE